jgi:hypothetical protein
MTEDQIPILDSNENIIQNTISTIILTIFLDFIGDPSYLKDKNVELLLNLNSKNSVIFNGIKIFYLPVSCSKKTQINHYRKKIYLLVYQLF